MGVLDEAEYVGDELGGEGCEGHGGVVDAMWKWGAETLKT